MILASQSPRRRELLGLFCPEFEVMPAQGEESLPDGISPREAVMLLSKQKAEEISARKFPDGNITDTIVAADTIVATDGEILGKPKSQENAAEMLRHLSGRVHSVFTGVTLITPKTSVTFAEETLTAQEIADYTASGEPMDKAGAYGIQGRGALLVKRIEGDYYNVMGLPVGEVYHRLKELGAL